MSGATVIAHRGASAYAPENTLAAFRLAAEMGAPWIELDCSLSRDGHAIVMHDLAVDRTTNGAGLVRALSLAELKNLDAGAWKDPRHAGERVPVLEEVLDFARNRLRVLIEIKSMDDLGNELREAIQKIFLRHDDPSRARSEAMRLIAHSGTPDLALTRKVIRAVCGTGMQDWVTLQSFSPIPGVIAAAEAPQIARALLAHDLSNRSSAWEDFLFWGGAIGIRDFNVHWNSIDAGRMEAVRRLGWRVSCWTVDAPDEMMTCLRLGVDGLITNRPDVAMRVADAWRRGDAPPERVEKR